MSRIAKLRRTGSAHLQEPSGEQAERPPPEALRRAGIALNYGLTPCALRLTINKCCGADVWRTKDQG